MATVFETNDPDANNDSYDLVKKHHGEIIYEASGFVTKIHRKDSQLNRRVVNTYTDLWKEDRKDLSNKDETIQKRREQAQTMTNAFYDIVTDFYEYGWGESFHFARTYKGDTFEQSIKRHEQFLALKLGLSEKHRTLDVGCGVGGPLREIIRLSGAHVTGLNNNGYQIERCKAYAKKLGLESKTDYVKGDFNNIPRELDGKFDSAYAMEACVHSPKLEIVYGEVFRTLKPGGLFCTFEWVTTSKYDENNPEHKKIIFDIEQGNSIPSLSSYIQALEAAKKVGFEILEYQDHAILEDSNEPWFNTLKGSISLDGFRKSRVGRWITHKFVASLELLHLVAPGSTDVANLLNNTADALVLGGETGIFTPMMYILLRKPKDA
ncbi:5840_t:CDS:2 [Ambispora leptoticha]|uniref:Sterol 24-C-methyltransferase n=1 Tax=Ambispora leptoticha TaxID=144679 RepID=A0A9N9AJT4_9GLOM|nr:5840_t:CDS:2 [Ambispora leptoticha]